MADQWWTEEDVEAAKKRVEGLLDDYGGLLDDADRAALELLLSTLRPAPQETGWRLISEADHDKEYLLYAPVENLFEPPFDDPLKRPMMKVAQPRNWCWAAHFQELPTPPSDKEGA